MRKAAWAALAAVVTNGQWGHKPLLVPGNLIKADICSLPLLLLRLYWLNSDSQLLQFRL